MREKERVRLTLETEPSDVPAGVRLRRLLKALGRYYGWRLVEPVEEVEADGTVRGDERGPRGAAPVDGSAG